MGSLGTMIAIAVAAVLVVGIFMLGYVKAPPDKAFLISGLTKEPRIMIGKAGIRIPFLERLDRLYLGQMTVDIKTDTYIPTNDFINVMVDAVAKIRISEDPQKMKLAARNFLNKTQDEIAADLTDSLQGNMREIIGTLSLRAINTDRDSFSDQVMEKASKDMEKLGIEILSCNIQNVEDEHGLIQDMGMDNTSKIRKEASIAKAEAERDIAIAQAAADKAANDARVLAETEIAKRNTELDIKKAELKTNADTKKAEADAAYEIQSQEQQKSIQIATVNAQIAKAEREAELRRQEVEVQQQALEAEINKTADAERYRVEQEAAAQLTKRQREAEAKKYEQEKEAEAKKAMADAARYAAEQEAEGIRAKGEAEADAVAAKAKAEAEGMQKKAEAFKLYNNAAIIQMLVEILPEMASEVSKSIEQIDKITIFGGGNSSDSVGSISDYVPIGMAKTFETIKEATGVDLAEVIRGETYDAKVNRNIHLAEIPELKATLELKKESEGDESGQNRNTESDVTSSAKDEAEVTAVLAAVRKETAKAAGTADEQNK